MIPYPAVPVPELFVRSLACNVPLVLAIVAGVGGVYLLTKWRLPWEARSAFLQALAASGCNTAFLRTYLDAKDPVALAITRLGTDTENDPALRAALAPVL